jgi:dolichol-phosphate mannosyltransferase
MAVATESPQRIRQQEAATSYAVSLVIPAWNEAATIRQAIREASAALAQVATAYEIIVVDDGSTDETAQHVHAEMRQLPRLRYVRHEVNRGYGAALRSGFQAATMDLVAFTDADCQFHLADLGNMLPLTETFDLVCGYRLDRQDSARRRFLSWGYNQLVAALLGSPVRDIDCALKVFRAEALREIMPACDNFFVNTEMLAKARQCELKITELGVRHRARAAGESKVSLGAVPRTLRTLLPFWWSRVLFAGAPPERALGTKRFWASLLLLMILAGVLLFPNLSYPLLEPDEGRYAEIAREMAQNNEWIVPTLNQRPYYDKPPLLYWLTAGSFKLFGAKEWAARLIPASAAWLTVLLLVTVARRHVGAQAALLSGLVLVLTTGFMQCGRLLLTDSLLTLLVTAASLYAFQAVHGARLRWGWWIASAVCCGLGVLTKGPVALILLLPPTVAFLWLTPACGRVRLRAWLIYVAVALGLFLPWFVTVSLRDGAFPYEFVVNQHLRRYFQGAFHPAPVWYYVPVLLLAGLPWTLLIAPIGWFAFSRARRTAVGRPVILGFLLLCAGWCLLLFSLSRGKLPPYILPLAPPLALVAGIFLDKLLFEQEVSAYFRHARNLIPRVATVLVAAAWLTAMVCFWLIGIVQPGQDPMEFIEAGICVACIFGLTLWGNRLSVRAMWTWCAALVFWAALDVGQELVPAYAANHSLFAQHPELRRLLDAPDTVVACWGREWGSVPFYLRDVQVCNFHKLAPEQLRAFLRAHERTLLIAKRNYAPPDMQWVVPPGRQLTGFIRLQEASVFVIERKRADIALAAR